MMKYVRLMIDYFENHNTPLGNYIASFLFFVLLRNFIEVYATEQDNYLLQTLLYSPFYIALACWFIFLFHIVTGEEIIKVAKIVLSFQFIILLPPVIDILFSPGSAVRMKYGAFSDWKSFCVNYLLMGDSRNSLGQRIEEGVIIICSFFYFYCKTNRAFLSVLNAILTYTLIALFGTGPTIINNICQFMNIPNPVSQDYFSLARLYFILTISCVIPLFYLHQKEKFRFLVKDIRPLRIAHYLLMVGYGIILLKYRTPDEISIPFAINTESMSYFILIPISGIFAALFTIISNNAADLSIDRIANPGRPLASNRIGEKEYMTIGYFAVIIAGIASILVNRSCFIFMGLTLGCYYLYSNPPFNLKRIPLLSKLIIGINSTFMALMGYTVFGGAVLTFPQEFLFFFTVCFGLSANFIDLKDYLGDKAAGIRTLPVLLGMKSSKIIISGFTILSYGYFYFYIADKYIVQQWLLLPMPIFLAAHLYFLNRKEFREEPVFLIYLCGIAGAAGILFLDAPITP